jgi:two-component system phosphate regulon response regulator OmpR
MLLFAKRAGDTIPRHELIGNDVEVGERTIDVQINRLRRKIEDDPSIRSGCRRFVVSDIG